MKETVVQVLFFSFFLSSSFLLSLPPTAHLAASVVDEFGEEKIQRLLDQAQNNCFGWWDSTRKLVFFLPFFGVSVLTLRPGIVSLQDSIQQVLLFHSFPLLLSSLSLFLL